jgi:alpha-L-fucosidase
MNRDLSNNFLIIIFPILITFFAIRCGGGVEDTTDTNPQDSDYVQRDMEWTELASHWECPEWFKDAKFGLWISWGPQTIPLKGGGWYARHMYLEPDELEEEIWGIDAWNYHRETYGHQSEFGYKDVCNLWKAEKFDAYSTLDQFKKWGARYVAIIATHHDNFDLFYSSVHDWNTMNVGPMRDIVGELAEAARDHNLKWIATVHSDWATFYLATAFGTDSEGPMKDIPYDGHLTMQEGIGKWWEGLDPQQLYALNYDAFEEEYTQRYLELVVNYRPDILFLDAPQIIDTMEEACENLYNESLKRNGTIQTIITVREPQIGTVHEREKGVAEELQQEYWQTDTTIAQDWFFKPRPDGTSNMCHDARSLKELLVDIVSKRGALLLNIAIHADGTIPEKQVIVMDEFGDWLNSNSESIYGSRPWKIYGEGGVVEEGIFKERGITSIPWDQNVVRFTRDKANTTLYVHVFGDPVNEEIVIGSLGSDKDLFIGTVNQVSIIGTNVQVYWLLQGDGLHVKMPSDLPFKDCNVLKVETDGL